MIISRYFFTCIYKFAIKAFKKSFTTICDTKYISLQDDAKYEIQPIMNIKSKLLMVCWFINAKVVTFLVKEKHKEVVDVRHGQPLFGDNGDNLQPMFKV